MPATPSLEERVTTVEDTIKQLITSLRPPDAMLKKIDRDIQTLNRTTAVAHKCILDMVTESEEVQKLQEKTVATVTKHDRRLAELKITVTKHGQELAEIKSTVAEHTQDLAEIKTTIAEHGQDLTRIRSTVGEIKSTLDEHGSMLQNLGATLNVVVTKLDKR